MNWAVGFAVALFAHGAVFALLRMQSEPTLQPADVPGPVGHTVASVNALARTTTIHLPPIAFEPRRLNPASARPTANSLAAELRRTFQPVQHAPTRPPVPISSDAAKRSRHQIAEKTVRPVRTNRSAHRVPSHLRTE